MIRFSRVSGIVDSGPSEIASISKRRETTASALCGSLRTIGAPRTGSPHCLSPIPSRCSIITTRCGAVPFGLRRSTSRSDCSTTRDISTSRRQDSRRARAHRAHDRSHAPDAGRGCRSHWNAPGTARASSWTCSFSLLAVGVAI